jgi:hypothetical protein
MDMSMDIHIHGNPGYWHSAVFGHLESAYNLGRVEDRRQVSPEHEEKTTVALSNGDIIFCHRRSLAAEIDIPPL